VERIIDRYNQFTVGYGRKYMAFDLETSKLFVGDFHDGGTGLGIFARHENDREEPR
jgi:hypothetical protein